MLHHGDCIDVMRGMDDSSVDAIVTDPPYELSFMGKTWDGSGIACNVDMWREALRVLKPGGHLLAFGGTRTVHRMAVAIEDAGFEIRDCIQWLYGSGFPKSLDVGKAIDKAAGAERTRVIGQRQRNVKPYDDTNGWNSNNTTGVHEYTEPATPEAQQWDGWGTALKPANEPIVVARKPLAEKTVAKNVLTHGTGALNIDGCRIETSDVIPDTSNQNIRNNAYKSDNSERERDTQYRQHAKGRWPANVILDEDAAAMLDEQSGVSKSSGRPRNNGDFKSQSKGYEYAHVTYGHSDTGGASRFFYVAKASRKERNAGMDEFQDKPMLWSSGTQNPGSFQSENTKREAKNNHPTVKPIALMRYLVRLVTPPEGTVLDPFAGSGSTGCAAVLEGVQFIGIEQDAEYVEIARRRIEHYATQARQLRMDGAA